MTDVHHLARIDMNLLVVLDELLRSRSTTVAARRLGRTQSAVSHALARLRGALDDPLFVRAGASLRPTATAERMQAPLRDVLLRAEALLGNRSGELDPSRIERTFVIGGADYAEVVLLPRLLPLLRRAAPGVDVVTRFAGDELERAVQAREIDLGCAGRMRPLSGVVVESMLEEPMRVVLRRGHPALERRLTPRRFAALDHVLVTPRGLPGSSVDTALEPLGLSRRIVLRVPHFAAAAIVVAKTDAVVTLPAGFARQVETSLDLISLPAPFPIGGFTFAIAYSTTYVDDPAHRWFRERVLEIGRST